jgi:hypothetical protein
LWRKVKKNKDTKTIENKDKDTKTIENKKDKKFFLWFIIIWLLQKQKRIIVEV